MSEKELLGDFMELFPVEGQVVPYIELKFRLASKYSQEDLDEMLEKLTEKGVLNRFEFNNTVHYKSKKDIPIALSASSSSTTSADGADQLARLSELVLSIADSLENEEIKKMASDYRENYM